MPRVTVLTALLMLSAVLLASCGGNGNATITKAAVPPQFPMTIDNCGQKVTVAKRPEKAFVIGQAAADLVAAAGGADRVVAQAGQGVPVPDPYGTALKHAPITTQDDPGTESIIGSHADIVISYGLTPAKMDILKQAGISSLVTSGNCGEHGGGVGQRPSFDEVYADIALYGRLFGTQDAAAASIAQLKQRLAAVESGLKSGPRLSAASVYFYSDALSTNGNQVIMQTDMDILGLTNVFGDVNKAYIESNAEEFIKRNPDVIILSYGYDGKETFDDAKNNLLALSGVANIAAVKNDRIVALPSSQTEVDPLAISGLETIAKALGLAG